MRGPWDNSQSWERLGAGGLGDKGPAVCCGVGTLEEMAESVVWMVDSGWSWSSRRELGSSVRQVTLVDGADSPPLAGSAVWT